MTREELRKNAEFMKKLFVLCREADYEKTLTQTEEEKVGRALMEKFNVDPIDMSDIWTIISRSFEPANNVTVFFKDKDFWDRKESFDFRRAYEILPRGSVVVGFLTSAGLGVIQKPADMDEDTQGHDFNKVLREALDEVGLLNYWVEERGDELILQKMFEIA